MSVEKDFVNHCFITNHCVEGCPHRPIPGSGSGGEGVKIRKVAEKFGKGISRVLKTIPVTYQTERWILSP